MHGVMMATPFFHHERRVVSIGPYALRNCVVLAPMAGVTDLPFRELAWQLGAGLVVAEMTSANPKLAATPTSQLRRQSGEPRPHIVQIAGGNPRWLADAARAEAAAGAQIIDVNMGCPAKKVCNQAAGSALLRDETLVGEILRAVVAAVAVPVTVKIRTGWSPELRNGVTVARIAEDAGVASIAVHGRTRACRFVGAVEFDTIAAIKAAVRIPVFANGDIDSVDSARRVLALTGADGVLIGRAGLGAPWLPGDIAMQLSNPHANVVRTRSEILAIVHRHLTAMHAFYGAPQGVRIARKHGKAYLAGLGFSLPLIRSFNAFDAPGAQLDLIASLMDDDVPALAA